MSKLNIRPLGDRLVVKRLEDELRSAGGIVIPDSAKEKPIRGEVMAIGPGKVLENGDHRAMDLKVGDTILFGKYAGTEIKLNDKEYLVLREEDVLAVLV